MADNYEIAAWRFEQIAPFLDPSLDPAEPKEGDAGAVPPPRDLADVGGARAAGEPPKEKPIPRSTLHRWVKAFEKHGYPGLFPKRRQDQRPRSAARARDLDPVRHRRCSTSSPTAR